MSDIFGINQKTIGATFSRGDTFVLRKGDRNIGLAQNISMAFSRPLQPVFGLGSSNVSMTTGRPQGQLHIARVIGKLNVAAPPDPEDEGEAGAVPEQHFNLIKLLGDEFYRLAEDSSGGELVLMPFDGDSLDPAAIAGAKGESGFRLKGCFVMGEQFGGSAQDVVIIESVQIQFISMQEED